MNTLGSGTRNWPEYSLDMLALVQAEGMSEQEKGDYYYTIDIKRRLLLFI